MLALTPAASLAAHTPLPPSAEGGKAFAPRMVEDIPLPPQEYSCIPRTRRIRRYKKSRWRKPSAFLVSSSPSPTPHVRGGSVSRRGLNQLARNRTTSQAEPPPKNRPNPNASRSSGERGLGGEALLSEKRPLPPAFLTSVFSGGSAREGAFLQEKPPPSHLHQNTIEKQKRG